MNNERYWEKRAKEREEKWTKKSKEQIEKELKILYARALRNIQKDVNDLYERFSVDNGLTMAEAKKLITGNEYKIWRMDIEKYVELAIDNKEIKKELNTLAMRSRISRLDKLYGEILMEISNMSEGYNDKLTNYLKSSLKDNYYQNTFDICKGVNILMPVSELDKMAIEDIIRTPWSGKHFSKRIWTNTAKLAKVLKTEISNAIIRGVNARDMATVVSNKMDSSYKQAITLVRSELNYVNNQASIKSIDDAGGKEYRYIATLDKRTSEKCRRLDNTVHKIKDGVAGTNMPPMHPRCRSTISIANLTANTVKKRISRVGGEIKYVPADMTYKDWESIYVKKTSTLAEWESKNRHNKIKTVDNKDTALAKAIGEEHHNKVTEMVDKAPDKVADLWRKLENKIKVETIKSGNYKAYATPNGIHLDINLVSKGNKISMPYQTLFHEGGHALDFYLARTIGDGYNVFSAQYNNNKFITTLKTEVNDYVNSRNRELKKEFNKHLEDNDLDWFKENKYLESYYKKIPEWFKFTKENTYINISEELKKLPLLHRGNISDILEGATKYRIHSGIGHSKSYWEKTTIRGIEYGLATEAFAELIDASIANKEALTYIKKYIPKTYEVFEEMIDYILKEVEKDER